MNASFTSRGIEDAALRIVVRKLVDELAARSDMRPDAYRGAFLQACVTSAESATIAGDDAENARTAILVALVDFLDPI